MSARPVAALTVGLLVAGCTSSPPAEHPPVMLEPKPPEVAITQPYPRPEPPPAPIVLTEPSAVARALDHFNRTRQRPARDQRIELDAVRKAFAGSHADYDRVRLALLLSLPNAPFADDHQALELLEPLARDAGNEFHPLAQLMTALLNEHRRLERQSTALQQKLDRLRALEKEMQQRAATPESKRR